MKKLKLVKIKVMKKIEKQFKNYLSINSTKGFSLLAGINRPINPSQVTKLSNSIDKMGVIRPVVVATISFLDDAQITYIIDGQHLYMACLRLGIDIPYIEIDIKDVRDLVEKIALLNASSKSWILRDYVQAWKPVNSDYSTLDQLFQMYDIEMSQLAQILHYNNGGKGSSSGSSVMSRILKQGTLKIKNLVVTKTILNRITDALKLVPRMDRVSNKTFISAFCDYAQHPLYDHASTLKYLKANKTKFALSTNDPEEFNKLFSEIK
jgi:hypothetical protein